MDNQPKITINGVRNIPLEDEVDLSDPNSEFRIVMIVSPTALENRFEEGVVGKVKMVMMESITPIAKNG